MAKISFDSSAFAKQIERMVSSQEKELVKSNPSLQTITDDIMRQEAVRLAKCIQFQIDAYYASYSPTVYSRTGELREVIQASPRVVVSPDGKSLVATVEVKSTAGHSIFPNGGGVDKVAVIDKGWAVKKDVWFKNIEHFGFQAGYGFIDKGIADYLKSNPHNITVSRV